MQKIRHDSVGETQASESCLCIFEANCVAMTRPLPVCPSTRCISRCSTDASLVVRPGDSTLVESLMNSVAPSRPARSPANHMSLHHNLNLVPSWTSNKHVLTYLCTYTRTYTIYIRMYIHIHILTYVRAYVHIHTYMRTRGHVCIHTHTHTHTHTYIRTCIRTCIRTRTHIHTNQQGTCLHPAPTR